MKLKKICIWLLAGMVYLNVGWMFGTYYNSQVWNAEPTSTFAKILAGGWGLLHTLGKRNDLVSDQVTFSIVWPAALLVTIFTWIVFGIWQFLCLVWLAFKFLLWLIFAGGLYELIGSTGVIIIAWISVGLLAYHMMLEVDKGRDEEDRMGKGGFVIGFVACIILAPVATFFAAPAFLELRKKRKGTLKPRIFREP